MKENMGFNYYSFVLDGKERIYYTYVVNSTEEDILDWAVRFSFIDDKDKEKCSNVKPLTDEEVEEKNRELYKVWWEKREKLKMSSVDELDLPSIPPSIGEVQLN